MRVSLGICVLSHKLHSYLPGLPRLRNCWKNIFKTWNQSYLFTSECSRLSPRDFALQPRDVLREKIVTPHGDSKNFREPRSHSIRPARWVCAVPRQTGLSIAPLMSFILQPLPICICPDLPPRGWYFFSATRILHHARCCLMLAWTSQFSVYRDRYVHIHRYRHRPMHMNL